MSEQDQEYSHSKQLLEDKKKSNKQIVECKKKLLEIYVIASGLIIASTQSTISLMAINTSVNETAYKNIIVTTKELIKFSNLAFFLLLLLLLIYYTGIFDKSVVYTFIYTILISMSFSFVLTEVLPKLTKML